MKLFDDLINSIREDAPIRSVQIGANWVVVCSRFCGMASAIRGEHRHGIPDVKEEGILHHKSAMDLAQLVYSDSTLEASIGLAAINSLLDIDESQSVEVNAADVLANQGRGKNVALIGHFPFVEKLRPSVGQLWVIEKNPKEGDFPASSASDLLPCADIVAITGSALINGTMDTMLSMCPPEAIIMVLGPSTPISPILFNYGIDILSGVQVVDENAVLRTVGQGASFRQVEGVRLLTFTKDKELR